MNWRRETATVRLKQSGFSLVELMVVITLLGIALAMAVPSFLDWIDSLNLRSAARSVASDIFLVRGRAVSENRAYRMTFSRADNTYRIYKRNDSDSDWEGPFLTRSLSSLGAGVVFDFEDSKSINFQARGTVSANTITLCNKDSDASITINFAGRSYVTLKPK